MKSFTLQSEFRGYRNKKDQTNIGPQFLVEGSQNVDISDGEKITATKGYVLDGESNSALTPIESSFDWDTSSGTQINLRSYDDELEYRYVTAAGDVTHRKLADGWSSVDFNYATIWDTSELRDSLIFTNGDSNLYSWSGGIAVVDSVTSNTITKQGVEFWAEARFNQTANKTIIIDGDEYTYTGGEGTTTLTGVSPDPSAAGVASGDVAHQKHVQHSNTPAASYVNDEIGELNNQLYVGSSKSRLIYVSRNTDFTSYSSSSPRAPGEGEELILDGVCKGFVPQEDSMYISAGKDSWFKTDFRLSSDNLAENLSILKLKTAPRQAAFDSNLIAKIKNEVVFISNEPTLDTLGRLENIVTPQSRPLSDQIKVDFNSYDYTGGHIIFHQGFIHVTLPQNAVWLRYDTERKFWLPPRKASFSRFSIVDGDLYAHSALVPESYRLFTGNNDNGAPINCIARMSYRHYGTRAWQNEFDEWFTEGYIASNTDLNIAMFYDYEGATSVKNFLIEGDDQTIRFASSTDLSLGKNSLGKQPLGSSASTVRRLPKFRVKHTVSTEDFYELLVEYSTNDVDQEWELLAFGGNVKNTKADDASIKK